MKKFLLPLALVIWSCSIAQIVNIPDPNFKTALLEYSPTLDTNGDGEIQVSEAEAFTGALFMDDKDISDLTGIEAFINIVNLGVWNNNLTSLDVSSNTALLEMSCGGNLFTTLDVSANVNLEKLDVLGGKLEELDLSNNINLIDLNVISNNLSSLDISNNTNLLYVIISNNQISTFDVSQNIALEQLAVSNNGITSMDISQNVNLRGFIYNRSPVTSVDLSNNPNLSTLVLYETDILDVDLSNNPLLARLDIHNTGIDQIDLSNNPVLGSLDISNTPFQSIDISNNPELWFLNVSSTPLPSIDLSVHPGFYYLIADNTLFTELDLSNNPMCRVRIRNNFDLEYINLRNGVNEYFDPDVGCANNNVPSHDMTNNPNLAFICVDDVDQALEIFTEVPPQITFVEDCSIANSGFNRIDGMLTYDDENDGCDGSDEGIANLLVRTTDGLNDFATNSIGNGAYSLTVAENTYTTTVIGLPPYFDLAPAQEVDTFVGFDQVEIADFCISANTTANDLVVSLVPIGEARPGFEANYQLIYENVGTTDLDATLSLNFDDVRVSFESGVPLPDQVNTDNLVWDLGEVGAFQTGSIDLSFLLFPPPVNESDDILSFTAQIESTQTDQTPEDNLYVLDQLIVNSQDPNDKLVAEGGEVLIENADQYLHYTVRFQNVGTASAINVRIQDQIDPLLDIDSFRLLDSSHPMELFLVNGQLDFVFDDINLPSVEQDPEGSQGYVVFKLKPVPGIQLGDMIANTADIYFDFNAAIVTNTVTTTFVDVLGNEDQQTYGLALYPNPTKDLLQIRANEPIQTITFYAVNGAEVGQFELNGLTPSVDLSGFASGLYFTRVLFADGTTALQRVIVE